MDNNTILDREPDVEAVFENSKASRRFIFNGYRPAHLVREDYLTTGVHYYFDQEIIEFGQKGRGYITFLTPEAYPKCLWIGKRIPFMEGKSITGYATITKIFNKILESDEPGVEGNINI